MGSGRIFCCCAGVSAKQFDVLLKVMKQQQQQKPKLQPVPSPLQSLQSVNPHKVHNHAPAGVLCYHGVAKVLFLHVADTQHMPGIRPMQG